MQQTIACNGWCPLALAMISIFSGFDGIVIGTVYELTLLTAFKRSWFLLSSCPIMPIEPSPPPMPPNPNFKSFCTNDGWCKWLPTNPPTPWFPRCPPLCGPWPCEFCADRMAAWSCCCCCWDLWCCCCCCWDDFIESCFIFSCSSRSRLAYVRQFIRFLREEKEEKLKLFVFIKKWPKNEETNKTGTKTNRAINCEMTEKHESVGRL